MEQGVRSVEKRFLLERNPNLRRIAAKRLAKEAGRRNSDQANGMTVKDHGRANDSGSEPYCCCQAR